MQTSAPMPTGARGDRPRAVIFDALGTLVRLCPPAPRLRERLAARGIAVSEGEAAGAFAAEIDHYLVHHLEGSSPAALDRLYDDCARVLAEALALDDVALVREVMLQSIAFRAYDDAWTALAALRSAGLSVAVASNWDCSLPTVLEDARLLSHVDAVVTSAEVGAAKPSPEVLHAALAVVGCAPDEAVCVGDSLEHDVAAARAAGLPAVLVARGARRPAAVPPGVRVVSSLSEAQSLVLTGG